MELFPLPIMFSLSRTQSDCNIDSLKFVMSRLFLPTSIVQTTSVFCFTILLSVNMISVAISVALFLGSLIFNMLELLICRSFDSRRKPPTKLQRRPFILSFSPSPTDFLSRIFVSDSVADLS